jgi:hypothetical protein
MKINTLETHDRLQEFQKQADNISQGCQECIANRPAEFENRPFYIFAHKREIGTDERIEMYNSDLYTSLKELDYARKYRALADVPTARLIWEPRLTKPAAQENSMLFKSYPSKDLINVIWIIPARELWDQYQKGKMTENMVVCESIYKYINKKEELEAREEDDLSDEEIHRIYSEISRNAQRKKGIVRIV